MEPAGVGRHLQAVLIWFRHVVSAVAFVGAACPSVAQEAAAASGPDELQVVTVGTHARLTMPREVERLAVGDAAVLAVELLDTRELLVLGSRTGTTTVLVWYADGTRASLLFRVQRDLSLLQSALDDIHAGIRAQMAPDRDALVLTGVVPDELHRQAILQAAASYLDAAPRDDVRVAAAGGDAAPADVQVRAGAAHAGGAKVIDLLRLAELPAPLEDRILAAIRPVAGDGVRVRRLQRSPLSDDEQDVLVLEGSVPDQIALVRAMQLASRLFLGDEGGGDAGRDTIEVLADEAGGLVSSRGNQLAQGGQGQFGGGGGGGAFGAGGGGAGGGFAGGVGVGVQRNEVQRNLGRATVLSMAKGRILSFLEVADRPQVRVSVQLFEIDRDRLFQFSSELQLQGSDFDQPALGPSRIGDRIQPGPANVGAFSDSDVQAGLASLASGFGQQIQVSGQRLALDTLLQALEARGIARRLSSPVMTVLNGETAQFQVGGEIPVPQAFTPAASAGSGLGTFASVDFRSFGVGLGIRPLVGTAGEVTLDLSTIVSQPDESLTTVVRNSTGTDPQTTAFATRALRTNARLQDGQSLLVGGLVARDLRDDVSKTPLLGDLPLIGWLFRSANDNFSQSELFVLVSPSVVRPPVAGSEIWLQPSLTEILGAAVAARRGGDAGSRATPSADAAR